jgi:hypothetical protein
MASFVHVEYPTEHPGVARAEAVVAAAQDFRRGFDTTKGLAAMLLAAVASALLVVADQVIDTWADGHLLMAWVALWAVGFVAIGLFAGTARSLALRTVAALNAWSARTAQARADQRLWSIAQTDSRVMADLQTALSRSTDDADIATAAALKERIDGLKAADVSRPLPGITIRHARLARGYLPHYY